MKYAVEMGSVAMIPSFIKIGSRIRKLMGVHRHTERKDGDRTSLL
jgi:hypothetical protein